MAIEDWREHTQFSLEESRRRKGEFLHKMKLGGKSCGNCPCFTPNRKDPNGQGKCTNTVGGTTPVRPDDICFWWGKGHCNWTDTSDEFKKIDESGEESLKRELEVLGNKYLIMMAQRYPKSRILMMKKAHRDYILKLQEEMGINNKSDSFQPNQNALQGRAKKRVPNKNNDQLRGNK